MDHTMKVWYDTEFLEDGRSIELISIGIIRQDGNTYYAVNREAPWNRIAGHDWLVKNVVRHLPIATSSAGWIPNFTHELYKPRTQIAAEVLEFLVGSDPSGMIPHLELNAYYAAHDHVALMGLWGAMVDAPEGIPWYTRDLKVEADRLGLSNKSEGWPQQDPELEHNAMFDALHDREIDKFLREQANGR